MIALIRQRFIPVAADDWYGRRRDDPIGRYFRYIVAQMDPELKRETFQGIYVFTARGRLLSYQNRGRSSDATLQQLNQSLHRWHALPTRHTRPGALKLPPQPDDVWDARFAPTVPENTLILNVFARALAYDHAGQLQHWTSDKKGPIGTNTALDHVWLREAEWRKLIQLAKTTDRFLAPREVAIRLARFHLVDNTRGEPDHWQHNEIHQMDLVAEIHSRGEDLVRVELQGAFALATNADLTLAERGYVGDLLGQLTVDLKQDRIRDFTLVAIGEHWGESRFTPHAREGRTPLAILIESPDDTGPQQIVPPQGLRSPERYFGLRP